MSMAIKYAMGKKAKKMADGGEIECTPSKEDRADKSASISGAYSDGGMVDRIMRKRMAGGGEAVDREPNEFDEMELEPAPKFSETGANSGDEDGDAELDENDHDLVSRIMRSRAKKDKMPRPA